MTVKVSFLNTNRMTAVSCFLSLQIKAIGPCFISQAPIASAWIQFSSLIFKAAYLAIAIDYLLPSKYTDSLFFRMWASYSHLASFWSMISCTFLGARIRLALISSMTAGGADFFCSATSVAKRMMLSTWWKKLLVAATQTSLPTLMQMGQSTFLARVEPSTLMMPMVFTLGRCLQSPTMLIRSLVSPDWLTSTTVSFSVMSEGSISTGSTMFTLRKHRSFLKKYSLADAAQQLDPQASMVKKSPNSIACTRQKLASKGMTACCRISQLYQCLYWGGGRSSTFWGYVIWMSLSLIRYFNCGISVTFSSKISWSLEGKKQFTCFQKAILYETTKISSSSAEKPISKGEPLVAVQMVSGLSLSIMTRPHCDSLPALALNSSRASGSVLPWRLLRARN